MISTALTMRGIGQHHNIDWNKTISGLDGERQRALVNIQTTKGSDPAFRSKGTDLLARAINGNVFDFNSAQHIGNFAAVDTRFFMADTRDTSAPYITDVTLKFISGKDRLNYEVILAAN